MAFSGRTALFTAVAAHNASSNIIGTVANAAPAGSLVVVYVAGDNGGAAAGDSTEITVSDNVGGNTWTRAKEQTQGGAANSSATVAIYYSILTNALGVGNTVTGTFSGARAAKTLAAEFVSFGAGSTISLVSPVGQGGTGVPADIAHSGATIGQEYFATVAVGIESNTSTGTWSGFDGQTTSLNNQGATTNSGGSAANMALRCCSRIHTAAATTPTWDAPVGFPSGDHRTVAVLFRETASGTNIQPGSGSVTIAGFAPTIASSSNQSILPGKGDVTVAGFAPTIVSSNHQSILPGKGDVIVSGHAPSIQVGVNTYPGSGAASIIGFAPTIASSNHQSVTPGKGDVLLAGFAPTIQSSDNQRVLPGAGALAIVGFAPAITSSTGSNQNVEPGKGDIGIAGFAPSITSSDNRFVTPGAGALIFEGFAPSITSAAGNQTILPLTGEIFVVGYAPTIESSSVIVPPPSDVGYGGGGGARVSAARRRAWERAIARAMRIRPQKTARAARRPETLRITIEREIRRLRLPEAQKRQLIAEFREPEIIPFLRGIATFSGLRSITEIGIIKAEFGSTAEITPIFTSAELGTIIGDGVQNPSDEELIEMLFQ